MSTIEQDNTGTPTPRPLAAQPTLPDREPEAEKDDGRDYVVMKRSPQSSPSANQVWETVAAISATSTEQAIRRAVELPGTSFLNADGPTTLVAIPARSFQPIQVQVQTTTKVILS